MCHHHIEECSTAFILTILHTVCCVVTRIFHVLLGAGTGLHSSPLLSVRHSVHTQLEDAYLCQKQLTQDKITLSLTHKGQADHSLAKLSIHSPRLFCPFCIPHKAMWRLLFSLGCPTLCDNIMCLCTWFFI